MKAPNREQLAMRAYELFNDEYLIEQWIEKSLALYQSGKHLILTGHYPKKGNTNGKR